MVVGVMAALSPAALASRDGDDDGDGRRKVDFVGVFHPVVTGFAMDASRCPDPQHPLLLTFQGDAYTTLGHATFEQSHCEGFDHTSFERGRQAITFDDRGDRLLGTYSGSLLATPTTSGDLRLIIDGLYHNTGGTGRFTHAHGRGISAGVVDSATGEAEVAVSGTL
jgi:hypothetical protein